MLLPAEPGPDPAGPPGADLATEYTSGSFKDFFAADDDELVTGAVPAVAAADEDAAGAGSAAAGSAVSAGRRPWLRSLVVAVAVLAAGAVAAGFTLRHQRPGPSAQVSRSLGVVPTASASPAPTASASPTPRASAAPTRSLPATRTPSGTPTLAVVPAPQTAATPAGHWPAWSGNLDHYQSLLAAEQALLRARQRLQLAPHLPYGGLWPALRRGAPAHFGVPHSGFHRR